MLRDVYSRSGTQTKNFVNLRTFCVICVLCRIDNSGTGTEPNHAFVQLAGWWLGICETKTVFKKITPFDPLYLPNTRILSHESLLHDGYAPIIDHAILKTTLCMNCERIIWSVILLLPASRNEEQCIMPVLSLYTYQKNKRNLFSSSWLTVWNARACQEEIVLIGSDINLPARNFRSRNCRISLS